MAFVFKTGSLDLYLSEGVTSVVGLVGHDGEHVYLFEAGIEVIPGDIQFYFYLIRRHPPSDTAHSLWSGLHVAPYIGREDRALVLEQVLIGARYILEIATPKSVFRSTIDVNPPPAALRKHEKINKVFSDLGYKVTPLKERLGKYAWRAELP